MNDSSSTGPRSFFRGLREPSITTRICSEIIRFIDAEQLQPGDRLPSERDLASQLGVSRPSVREANRILQSEGRVNIVHGRGVFVTDSQQAAEELRRSLIEFQHTTDELFAMREVLEVPAARWAAELQSERGLAEVQKAHDLLSETSYSDPPNFDQLLELDMNFHLAIVRASGNRFLTQTQGVLNEILMTGMLSTLRIPGRLDQSREEHRAILDALLSGDGEAAAQATKQHIHNAQHALLEKNIRK